MDYKKYSVKNFLGKDSKLSYVNRKEEVQSYPPYADYEQPHSREPFSERTTSPQIVYLSAPVSNSSQRSDLSYDFEAVPIEQIKARQKSNSPKASKSHGRLRKAITLILIILILIMSSFVASDYITEGKLLSTVNGWIVGTPINYYAVSLGAFEEYEEAMDFSVEVRERSGGGYIMVDNSLYCVIGDVYEKQEDAEIVAAKQAQGRVVTIVIPKLKSIKEKKLRAVIEENISYNIDNYNLLKQYIVQIAKLELDSNSLKQQLLKAKAKQENILKTLEKSEFSSNDLIKEILVDMTVNVGLFDNLITDSPDRPNLICDLRYYSLQMLINQKALVTKLNEM